MKKKLLLQDVTLLTATSVDIDDAQLSMRISLHNIKFGAAKLLSSALPKEKYPDIEYISIPVMNGIEDYNRFIIEDLHKYFSTSHCLIVQSDSFVVNSNIWKNKFLEFDYIGAPWTSEVRINPDLVLHLKNTVGCGGFSLRSRKLLKTTAKINFDSLKFPTENEDIIVCHYLYEEMVKKGIRFAPPKLAAQFAMEHEKTNNFYGYDVNSVFGFHGKHLRDHFLKKYILRSSIGEW